MGNGTFLAAVNARRQEFMTALQEARARLAALDAERQRQAAQVLRLEGAVQCLETLIPQESLSAVDAEG
jgi:hypothetical protein